MADATPGQPSLAQQANATPAKPVWQRRWFGWLAGLLLLLLILSFVMPPILAVIYEVRSILVPVLIAFGLAYVVNPAITYVHKKHKIPRWLGTSAVLALAAFIFLTFLLLVVPPIVQQSAELVDKLRNVYPQRVMNWIEEAPATGVSSITQAPNPAAAPDAPVNSPPVEPRTEDEPVAEPPAGPGILNSLTARVKDPAQWRAAIRTITDRLKEIDFTQFSGVLRQSLDVGVGVAASAIGFTTYLLLACVIVVLCFFFFAWRFDAIAGWFVDFIPASRRTKTLQVVRKMDKSIAAFIRGRLLQAGVMCVVLSVGWYFAGVPYWLLLGLLSGVCNLVPFLAAIGFVVALLLTVVDHTAGTHGFTLWTVLGPTLVYFVAQGLDGWVVEPLVQGQATNLDPITVMLVVLIGASVAGLLGMLIAIPTAACVKILAREVVLPKLRTLAAQH